MSKAEEKWLDVVLASDGDDKGHAAFVNKYDLDGFPYVVSELVGRSFGVGKLPYAVFIDEEGTISSMGLINSREHLESLFVAKKHGISSIQEYMKKSQQA